MRFLISGGGTGGHIFPAIAIANAIKAKRPDSEFLFVGAEGKMEMERVPKAGFPIKGLDVRGFDRKNLFKNFSILFKLLKSMGKAKRIIKDFRPDAVIGTGGYASGPALRAGKHLPMVIQEQNSYAGVTNKLLAKWASKICVAYDGLEKFFPGEKLVVTGNPIRREVTILDGKRDAAYAHFGLDKGKKTILIVGGSLGARTLNEAVVAAEELLKEHNDVQLLWQCGKLYYEKFSNTSVSELPNVHLTQFIDKMDYGYAAADVIISRGGAIAISELCLVGKPVIIVPSPNVAEDHQTKNAKALTSKDAAIMVEDANAKKTLIQTAIKTLGDNSLSQRLSQNISGLAKTDAADKIADVILELVKNRKP